MNKDNYSTVRKIKQKYSNQKWFDNIMRMDFLSVDYVRGASVPIVSV